MRVPSRAAGVLAANLWLFSATTAAQVGPSRAYPISAAAPRHPPTMPLDQKPRTAIVDVLVGSDGRAIETTLVQRSGSSVYDERVRGYWKDQPFLPALDELGRPREDTLRITSRFAFLPGDLNETKTLRHAATIEGVHSSDSVARILKMDCKDFLWEYDFMARVKPKADLSREDIFTTSLAIFLAKNKVADTARDTLIAHWKPVIGQVVDACRAAPATHFFSGVFESALSKAAAAGPQ